MAQTTTTAGGTYSFTDLPPGEYYLVFINTTGEGLWTVANVGEDDEADSDVDTFLELTVDPGVEGDAVRTGVVTLEPGDFDRSWDAGLVGLTTAASSALGDRVWLDVNEDGIQGETTSEPGFEGISVSLFRINEGETDGVLVATQTTDENGDYFFEGLDPGFYYVTYEIPEEYTGSPQESGADSTIDSDPDPTIGRTVVFYLPSNFEDPTRDAGLFQSPLALDITEEPEENLQRLFIPLFRY